MQLSTFIWELMHPIQTFKVRLRKPLKKYWERISVSYRKRTEEGVNSVREFAIKGAIVALMISIIIWMAVFMYIAFYYTYMPNITHTRPVHFQYKSCEARGGICSNPAAHVQLTKRQQLLMVGQVYRVSIDIELPESETNKNMGMFMCCAEFRTRNGALVTSSCRSGILTYRSTLLHLLKSIVYSPMMLIGTFKEKQTIQLELFSSFEDDQSQPVTNVYVEIQSRYIELYSANLHIDAHFSGLRYIMFHWPYLSAAIGVSTNLLFLALIGALSWYHLQLDDENQTKQLEDINGTPTEGSISIKQEDSQGSEDTAEGCLTDDSCTTMN